jgi:hypothetical protein
MKSSYLANLNIKYIQTGDNSVYKITPDHFLKLSPWEHGDDRRIYEVEDNNYHMLTFENACMIVNKQFANTIEKWEHNGKRYIANPIEESKNIDEHAAMLSLLPSHKIIKKSESLLKELNDNQSLSISSSDGLTELKMVKYKGKIYYILIINADLPRVRTYNMFGEFCQWANIKHCKPIFNETDKRYI